MEDESVLPLLVANRDGYRALCRLITTAKLRAPKGESRVKWPELAEASPGLFALTGDEEGPVSRAWRSAGPKGADAALRRLLAIFWPRPLGVEIQRHFVRGEDRENRMRVNWPPPTGCHCSRPMARCTPTRPAARCSISSPASATTRIWTPPARCFSPNTSGISSPPRR